jgi:hypothetical protein
MSIIVLGCVDDDDGGGGGGGGRPVIALTMHS